MRDSTSTRPMPDEDRVVLSSTTEERKMPLETLNGGLVLPGGGQMTQSDGAGDIPLTTAQIDKIIEHKRRQLTDRQKQDIENNVNNHLEITIVTDDKKKIIQSDGAADEGEDDDAINSDLDDPEDELNSADEEEDDEGGMIMLCLYDKVQRVKNKWKYVLKDGIANINGKDYVFSRGTGESEW